MRRLLLALIAGTSISACTLMPHYQQPASPVANSWPADASPSFTVSEGAAALQAGLSADQIGWRDFFTDPRLQRLIEIALQNNRNLRIAVLNVAASQAQFRVQRSSLFPTITASGSEFLEKFPQNGGLSLGGLSGGSSAAGGGSSLVPTGSSSGTFRYFNAGIGFTNYELDLFGRERSLTTQAFEQFLAQSESRRSSQISLVGEVASDYFAVLADEALVTLTQDTLQSQTESYDLTKAMFDRDTTTLLSLRQAESQVDAAQASLAQYQRQLAQDTHALTLVLGEEIPKDLPPPTLIEQEGLLSVFPAGLPSNLLIHRPDIMSAEHSLRAANANIGAARAAFFPSIQLTASGGTASNHLSSLFTKGTGTWSFAPSITLPIFAGGQNRANLDLAHIEKNVAIAQYELAIQTAFREVSDALNGISTYRQQRGAQQTLVAADTDAYRLAQMRFRAGVDSYLSSLDSQRSLYAARQALVSLRQAELTNEVTLYKTLGGGWEQHTASTHE
jgi:outer membrane protein, multidrug efflux system